MKTKLILAASAIFILASCASTSSSTAGGVKPYPLDTCIVTGNTLGSMGDPITMTHGDQQVKFCCKPCIKKFQANPSKYLAGL